MAQQATMSFKRGDGRTHYFQIPVESWSAGGKLFFAAKAQPDDDSTDAQAVINKTFTDDDIVDESDFQYDPDFVTYALGFIESDTSSVPFASGDTEETFSGEFQYVPDGGQPMSYPDDDNYIQVVVYADIKVGTT